MSWAYKDSIIMLFNYVTLAHFLCNEYRRNSKFMLQTHTYLVEYHKNVQFMHKTIETSVRDIREESKSVQCKMTGYLLTESAACFGLKMFRHALNNCVVCGDVLGGW